MDKDTIKDLQDSLTASEASRVALKAALEKIHGPGGGDCGCMGRPCECFSEENMRIQLEVQRDWAQEALAADAATPNRFEEVLGEVEEALEKLDCIRKAGEDGERLKSCCDGEHVDEILMAGDRVFRLSYAHSGAFDKALAALRQMRGGGG